MVQLQQYRQKPTVIEAIQTPLDGPDYAKIREWTDGGEVTTTSYGDSIPIMTPEGLEFHSARRNDWIVRDTETGHMRIVASEEFHLNYDLVPFDDS